MEERISAMLKCVSVWLRILLISILYKGEHLNLSQFNKYFINPDRDIRKEAYITKEQFFEEHLEKMPIWGLGEPDLKVKFWS